MNRAVYNADVAVLGAGPAGTSLAALLARRGHAVHLFERERFPRFHIGESLLPAAVPVLREIGLDLDAAPYALRKQGAVFRDPRGGGECRFRFDYAMPGTFPYAYQVLRSSFDTDLAAAAEGESAVFHFGHTVRNWEEDRDGVAVEGDWGTCRAKLLVDASGQGAMSSQVRNARKRLSGMGILATFTHYENVRSQTAQKVFEEGDIVIESESPGSWLWIIPLPEGRLSAGRVQSDSEVPTEPEQTIHEMIAGSELLSSILDGADRCGPCRRVSNFSFYNTAPDTARTATLGDARGFLDPVFSSGVTLALLSAPLLAREIDNTLHRGGILHLDHFQSKMQRAYRTFEQVIRRYYRPGWLQSVFFADGKDDNTVREITSILAGDVWRDDNGWQNMLLKARGSKISPRSG